MRHILQLSDGGVLDVQADEEGCYTIVDGPCPKCSSPLRIVGRGAVTGFGTSVETICATEFKAHCRTCNEPIGVLQSIAATAGAA